MTREDKLKEFFDAAHSYEQNLNNFRLHVENFLEEYEELKEEIFYFHYFQQEVDNSRHRFRMAGRYKRENLVKELADVQYTLSGLALYLGVDLEEAFNRVHANNMSKLIDGKIARAENGKVLKPEGYVKADMRGL